MAKEIGTEEKIIAAAHNVFLEKGYEGTRMREIAEHANINKGLLHYYFRSKDKLFVAVFSIVFRKAIGKINEVLEADIPLFTKIKNFVDSYIDIILKNPLIPRFVINELNRNPDLFIEKVNLIKNRPNVNVFIQQLHEKGMAGEIRKVDPVHFFMHMISACIFPFLGKPLFQIILDIDNTNYQRVIEERKKEVTALLINSLRL